MPLTAKIILLILWFINLATSEKRKGYKTRVVCANSSAISFQEKEKISQTFLGCNQWG